MSIVKLSPEERSLGLGVLMNLLIQVKWWDAFIPVFLNPKLHEARRECIRNAKIMVKEFEKLMPGETQELYYENSVGFSTAIQCILIDPAETNRVLEELYEKFKTERGITAEPTTEQIVPPVLNRFYPNL